MTPKKIAFIFDMTYPYSIGGSEFRIHELSQRLSARHDVHLFGVKMWEGPDVIKLGKVTVHGVCRYKSAYNLIGRRKIFEPLKFAWMVYWRLRREKFDLIDCTTFVYFHCLTVKLYCWQTKTPLIFSWLQFWGDYWYDYLGRIGIIGKLIENYVKGLTPYHLAISQTTKNDLARVGIPADNIFLNYCGVSMAELAQARTAVVEQAKPLWDIVLSARLNHQKNIPLLIRAGKLLAKEYPDIRINIIGDGPDRAQLEQLTKSLKLERNVFFSGFIKNHADVLKQLLQSKIFVLPSLLEGLGIVVIEAQACGLPTIVIRHPWNASQELVTPGQNGLIAENDPEDLAKNISLLLADDRLRQDMSLNAIESAAKFDWDIIAGELEGYYGRIISASPKGSMNKTA